MRAFWIYTFAMVIWAGVASGQPSTRLRLTQIQDAPDTTNAYFIVAGQGDTILYKADIVSIDSAGRVFTVVVGTDTIRWEDTTGGGGDGNGIIDSLPLNNITINADTNTLEIYSDGAAGRSDTLLRLEGNYDSDDGNVILLDLIANGFSGSEEWSIEAFDGELSIWASPAGIKYRSDYSANYTNRSLVDKEWVLSQISDSLGTSGGAFSTTSNVTSNSPGTLANDDFVFGSSSLDDTGSSDNDKRFLFDKSQGAFFAGRAVGTEWDAASRGSYAAALGDQVSSTGYGSLATGYRSSASFRGEIAQAGWAFSSSGDAQTRHLSISREITGRTAALLLPDGNSQNITIPVNTLWRCRLEVACLIEDAGTGSAVDEGDYLAYSRQITIRNIGGTTTLVASTTIGTDQEEASVVDGSLIIQGDDTNDALYIYFDPDNTDWATDTKTRCSGTLTITQVQHTVK